MCKRQSIFGFSPRFKSRSGAFFAPAFWPVFCLALSQISSLSPVFALEHAATGSHANLTSAKSLDDELTALSELVEDGALMGARPKVESLLARYPQDARVALLAARLYRKMGLSALAIIQYERVRQTSPRMLEPLLALSHMHLENLSSNLAVQLAEDAVNIDPRSKEARLALLEALIANQSMRRARLESQKLAALYPGDGEVQHALYMVAMAYGEEEQALSFLRPAADALNKPSWQIELAELYQSMHRYSEARAVYERMLAADSSNLEALVGLAHLYEFDLGNYMSAIDSYRKILEIFPDDTGAHAGIERCMAKQADLALWVKGSLYRLFGLPINAPAISAPGYSDKSKTTPTESWGRFVHQ